MRKTIPRLSSISVTVGVLALGLSLPVSAHVTVKPSEVVTAGFQTFTVSVPNEKEIPTVSVQVLVPSGVGHVSPTQKTGWTIDVESDDDVVTSITWENGRITEGLRDEFTFSAQVPDKETELQWKAYQTYSDGTVVAWDQAESEEGHHDDEEGDHNSGPFSVTKVVNDSANDKAVAAAEKSANDAAGMAQTAMYIAIVAVVLGVGNLFFTTRKK